MRSLDPPLSALVVLGGLAYALFEQGAYHEHQHRLFAVVLALAGLMLVATPRERQAGLTSIMIASPLFVSSVVSLLFSSDGTDAKSTFLLIAMVAIGLAAGAAARVGRSTVEGTMVALATVVAGTAIVGVARQMGPWGRLTGDVWRGSSSLTYSNAAAAIVGPMALFAFIRAIDDDNRAYGVATTALSLGFVATQSRGGALALLVVAAATLWRRPVGLVARSALPVAAGVFVGAPVIVMGSAVSSAPIPVVVCGAALLGLALTALLWPFRERVQRPVAALSLFTVGSAAAALAVGGSVVLERFTLRSGTTAQGPDAEVLFGDRANEWSAAWERALERPVVGHGPGVVDLRWTESGRTFQALFVHNEYLELLVTHGVVGLVALAASSRLLARRSAPDLAVVGALATFLLHASVDFLWHLPALPVFFALLAGTRIDLDDRRSAGLESISERRHAVAGKRVGKQAAAPTEGLPGIG